LALQYNFRLVPIGAHFSKVLGGDDDGDGEEKS
jgi:hypothetical protein